MGDTNIIGVVYVLFITQLQWMSTPVCHLNQMKVSQGDSGIKVDTYVLFNM